MSADIADFKSELHRSIGDSKCYLSFDIDSLDPLPHLPRTLRN